MIPRVTFFFVNGQKGWTETFYSTAGSLQLALDAGKLLVPKRTDVLCKGAKLQYVRVSDDDFAGDSSLYAVPVGQQQNKDQNNFGEANAAYDGILIRLTTSEFHRRMWTMRGIPDEVQKNQEYDPTMAFQVNLATFRTALTGGGWGIKLVDKVSVLEKPIESLVNDWPNGIVTVTVTAHGYSNGDLVNIFGRMNCRGFRGLFRIFGKTANTFNVSSRRDVSRYNGNGKVRKQTYSVLSFAPGFQVMRLARRDTGGPSYQERGRRSALPRV